MPCFGRYSPSGILTYVCMHACRAGMDVDHGPCDGDGDADADLVYVIMAGHGMVAGCRNVEGCGGVL